MIYIVCTLSRRTKNRDNRRIGLKALVILPPIFLGNPIRFGLWNDFRICTAFRYSSLANHARISTVENRKLRMTIASRQSTNFKAAVQDTNNPWRWPKDLPRVHFKITFDMPLSFVMSR
jgi:hypothetical protein